MKLMSCKINALVLGTVRPIAGSLLVAGALFCFGLMSGHAQPAPKNILQSGDLIIASSANSAGSEGVANAIDGQPTRYLNFDGSNSNPSGFVVTPSLGMTYVTGMALQSANDVPDRDPKSITLEGSNDDEITAYDSGNWQSITQIDDIPAWTSRLQTKELFFDNDRAFKHYRWVVTDTQGPSSCCMHIAEVELLGAVSPVDVISPGDAVIASSSNSPGSEGVANAIDGKPTKYLNFDSANSQPSGFVVTPSIGKTVITGIHMQSANDAPDRDPKSITIEGSNDDEITAYDSGNWELITQIDDVPAWTDRFQSQVFIFENDKAFTSYRWTVLDTQGPSSCCMQVAEVGLLAVITTDCDLAAFKRQPVDTAVLDGEPATFLVEVNGPWSLQWYKNGEPISGADSTSYTTDAVNSGNVSNKYSVQIVGCEMSQEVVASIHDPGANPVSIGVTFNGSGANGAPTAMNPTDVTGIQLQANWNNVTDASGNNSETLLNSLGADENQVTLDFQSSGNWGSGTGDAIPTQRMLNGLIHSQPGSDSYFQFQNVPAGNHTLIVYTVGIPLQFQGQFYKLVGQSEGQDRVIYTDQMNVDEYNSIERFFRGTSTNPGIRTSSNYVRFDNVEPSDGIVRFEWGTTTTAWPSSARG